MSDLMNGNNVTIDEMKGEQKMEKLIFDENGNVVGLTSEARSELIDKIIECFDWCNCYPEMDRNAVCQIVDEWFKNKKDLLNLFAKSTYYNGNFAIEFNKPIQRKFDRSYFEKFLCGCMTWTMKIVPTVKAGAFDYKEIKQIISRLKDKIYYLESATEVGVPVGNLLDEYRREKDRFIEMKDRITFDERYRCDGYNLYDKATYDKACQIKKCFEYIVVKPTQFIDKATEDYINEKFPNFKAKEGQKTSRVVNKLAKMAGITEVTNKMLMAWDSYDADFDAEDDKNMYNVMFAKFADACNPFEVTKHMFISLHPCDYLTQSWGTNWTSCHTIDKENKHGYNSNTGATYSGCYSSGTMSYMLDGTSATMFILGNDAVEKAKEMGEPVPRKEMRQMFHIGKEKFVQGRLYPYDQTDRGHNAEPEDYVQYREIMQSLLSELWHVPNLWTNKRGAGACDCETSSYGTHYADYTHYSNVNVSYLKEYHGTDLIRIGHNPICPCCGDTHSESEWCTCDTCRDGGHTTWCEYHQEYEHEYEENMTYVQDYGYVCEDALENGDFHQCDRCGDWYYDSWNDIGVRSERDERWYCSERCAERDGYYWNDYYEDWLSEDEIEYSEIDNEDLPTFVNEVVWARYDLDTDDTTIALESSCEQVDGVWYDADLVVETYNGDYALENDCIKVGDAWYKKNDVVIKLDLDERYEFFKLIKKELIKLNEFSYKNLKDYLNGTMEIVEELVA